MTEPDPMLAILPGAHILASRLESRGDLLGLPVLLRP
jgi:hypothetical protein